MKTIKFNKDKTVLLEGKNLLTRIIDLKGESWREYPVLYKIGDYYYV
jgi:beta-xylosidase